MNLQKLNKQLVTFSAMSLLFLGSLFYFVSVAFKDTAVLQARQDKGLEQYKDILEK